MAQEKMLDESKFGAIAKEVTAFGELIRTHQDEKQAAMDEFDKERKRYHAGKISKKALMSSAKKVNRELKKLDKSIRKDISKLNRTSHQAIRFGSKQSPKLFRASVTGIKHLSSKKKKR